MKVNDYKICPQADLKNANLLGANLKNANLCGADLRWSSLNGASLAGTNLRGADLRGANLVDADLGGADLTGADLRRVNLSEVNLKDVTLAGANLERANLFKANLGDVNLAGANLKGANLAYADLKGVDLRDSFLSGSVLEGADLDLAKLPPFQIPQEGELIVWKSCRGVLVKLRIPAGARRTASIVGRKCRAEFAEVLVVYQVVSGLIHPVVSSSWDVSVYYQEGGMVYPDCYNPDPRVEGAGGIHFYLTRQEAIDHHVVFKQCTVGSRANMRVICSRKNESELKKGVR